MEKLNLSDSNILTIVNFKHLLYLLIVKHFLKYFCFNGIWMKSIENLNQYSSNL